MHVLNPTFLFPRTAVLFAAFIMIAVAGCSDPSRMSQSPVVDPAIQSPAVTATLPPLSETLPDTNRLDPTGTLRVVSAKSVYQTGELMEFAVEIPANRVAAVRRLYIRGLPYTKIPPQAGIHTVTVQSDGLPPGYHIAQLVTRNKAGKTVRDGLPCRFAIVQPPFDVAQLPVKLLPSDPNASSFETAASPEFYPPFISIPVPDTQSSDPATLKREWTSWLKRNYPSRKQLAKRLGVESFNIDRINLPAPSDINDPLFIEAARFRDWYRARLWLKTVQAAAAPAGARYGLSLNDDQLQAGIGSIAQVTDWVALPEFDPVTVMQIGSQTQSPRIILERPPSLMDLSVWQASAVGVDDILSLYRKPAGIDRMALEHLRPLLATGTRLYSPVAVLYSPASDAFVTSTSLESGVSDHAKAFRAWSLLLADINILPKTISPIDLARGLPDDISAVVLPRVTVLSRAERSSLLAFIQRGGMVITDHDPALYDEHGTPDAGHWARRLFGYDDRFSRAPVNDREWRGRAIDPVYGTPIGVQGDSLRLFLHKLTAIGNAVAYVQSTEGGEACLVRQLGNGGRTVYMNMDLASYIGRRSEPEEKDYLPIGYSSKQIDLMKRDTYGGAAIRDLMRTLFAEAGISGPAAIAVRRWYTDKETSRAGAGAPFNVPAENVRLACRSFAGGVLVMLTSKNLSTPVEDRTYRIMAPRVVHWYSLTDGRYGGQASFMDVRLPDRGRPAIFYLTGTPVYGMNVASTRERTDRGTEKIAAAVSLDFNPFRPGDNGRPITFTPAIDPGNRLIYLSLCGPTGAPVYDRQWRILDRAKGIIEYVVPKRYSDKAGVLVIRDALTNAGVEIALDTMNVALTPAMPIDGASVASNSIGRSGAVPATPVTKPQPGDAALPVEKRRASEDAAGKSQPDKHAPAADVRNTPSDATDPRAPGATRPITDIPAIVDAVAAMRDPSTIRDAVNVSVTVRTFVAKKGGDIYDLDFSLPDGFMLSEDTARSGVVLPETTPILFGFDRGQVVSFQLVKNSDTPWPESADVGITITGRRSGNRMRVTFTVPLADH